MDADPPVSRDPRLNRPSLSTRLSQHEIQQRLSDPLQLSPADAQIDTSGDQFIQGISQLVQTAVLEATHRLEREKIQARRSNTDSVLRRANTSAFPSTVEFFKQTQADEDKVLTDINQKIKRHETQYQRLLDDLKNKWASTSPKVSKPDDKVPQLQQDLYAANKKIGALCGDVRSLQDMLGNQQKGFASYTNSLALLKRDMSEVSTLKHELDELMTLKNDVGELSTLKSDVGELSTLKRDVEDLSTLKRDMEELSTLKKGMDELSTMKNNVDELSNLKTDLKELSTLKRNMDDISTLKKDMSELSSLQKNGDELSTLKNGLGQLSSLKTDLNELSQRLRLLEERAPQTQTGPPSDTTAAVSELSIQYKNLEQKTTHYGEKVGFLSSSYQRLSELPSQVDRSLKSYQQKLEQLTNGQSTTNPKLDKEVLLLKRRLDELQEIQSTKDDLVFAELEDLKNTLDAAQKNQLELSGSVKHLSMKVPAEPVEPKMRALFGEVQQLVEPLNIALRSLETRYNNLTTEGVVQQMVGAMQEMYPSADQIVKSLAAQKSYIDEELPPIKNKIQQLEIHANASTMLQREIESIKIEQKNLSLAFGAFIERWQWFSMEEFRGVQARLESLAERSSIDAAYRNQTSQNIRAVQLDLKSISEKQNNMQGVSHDQTTEDLRGIQLSLKSLTEKEGVFHDQTTENFRVIESNLDSLAEKHRNLESAYQDQSSEVIRGLQENLKSFAERQSKTESYFENQAADRATLEELLQKHESLNERVASLADSHEKLNSECAQAKTHIANQDSMRALQRNFAEVEKGTTQRSEKLRQESNIRKSVQAPAAAAPSESGSSQRDSTPKASQVPAAPPPKPSRIDTTLSTKIKRQHPSSYSDDEDTPGATPNSIRSPALSASPAITPGDIKRKKKKKKRKRELEGTITIDD
ncbi:hypothetical protein BJX70DRAFT_400745 [Aspergillus crustosus]